MEMQVGGAHLPEEAGARLREGHRKASVLHPERPAGQTPETGSQAPGRSQGVMETRKEH